MMMMMMVMSTFLAHDSIYVNAQYAEGGCVEDREKVIRIKNKERDPWCEVFERTFLFFIFVFCCCCCCCLFLFFRYRQRAVACACTDQGHRHDRPDRQTGEAAAARASLLRKSEA